LAIDDLPMPVVTLLNALGIPWPYINEQTVEQFADLTREFATAVQTTHEDATKAVSAITSAHRATSTQTMADGWDKLSAAHVTEIVDGCHILADGLDAAAGYIVAQKAEALVQLIEMAAEFIADQAASIATLGLAEAALPVIELATEKLMESLVQDLEQYVIGQVINTLAKPLFAKVEQMVAGLDWSQSGAGDFGQGEGLELDYPAVKAQTALLREHAGTMRAHASSYASGVRGLKF
jgi:hypothetical protein